MPCLDRVLYAVSWAVVLPYTVLNAIPTIIVETFDSLVIGCLQPTQPDEESAPNVSL
ncbi:hypothetical protein CALVIDRAFT_560902 [Calocera viscosa TUFC12733]|uniref:Uncharacterized protein n=1 Tax=Calocera viscosa (strain TUFC12733) TaxID=1330018 RepID=A0A167FT00_CALVF|nr:hypothetical protein CALVIDRAFT_569615 [Calocera viscosa TUFC12733]KZO99554.1 hypothetical protein CALVIDRAFT_560902 [Calocera viscosa TUFC12733]